MRLKTSILISTFLMILGFIPLSFNKNKNINYEIHATNIMEAIKIKEEVIAFYKNECFASSYNLIVENLEKKHQNFSYSCNFSNNILIVYYKNDNIVMSGHLYEIETITMEKRYFFN